MCHSPGLESSLSAAERKIMQERRPASVRLQRTDLRVGAGFLSLQRGGDLNVVMTVGSFPLLQQTKVAP